MQFLILFGLIWFILPVVAEIITIVTARPLIRISEHIDGFWDFLAGGEAPSASLNLAYGRHTLGKIEGSNYGWHARMWNGKEFVDSWSESWANHSETPPNKGDWRNE